LPYSQFDKFIAGRQADRPDLLSLFVQAVDRGRGEA
jgi:hypothetical protein